MTKRWISMAMIACAMLPYACGLLDPRPDPTRFLVLASSRELGGPAAGEVMPSKLDLGLGPVRLPEYLERSDVMVRTSATELRPMPGVRWAEPFDVMLERVLANDLVDLLRPQRIILHPWYASDRPQRQIEVEFAQLAPDPSGKVTLIARCWLRELENEGRTVARESQITKSASSRDPARVAAAISEAVADLADEIAHELKRDRSQNE